MMKLNLREAIRSLGFWICVYSLLITIALIIVSVSYSKHECPKYNYQLNKVVYDHLEDSLNNKIHEYEINIAEIGNYVDHLSDDELNDKYDSIFSR